MIVELIAPGAVQPVRALGDGVLELLDEGVLERVAVLTEAPSLLGLVLRLVGCHRGSSSSGAGSSPPATVRTLDLRNCFTSRCVGGRPGHRTPVRTDPLDGTRTVP